MKSFTTAIHKHYTDFKGRTSVKDFWTYTLIYTLLYIFFIRPIDDVMIEPTFGFSFLETLFVLGLFLPTLAITIRRLNDAGKSGWLVLFGFVPVVGWIVMFYFLVQTGLGENSSEEKELGHNS